MAEITTGLLILAVLFVGGFILEAIVKMGADAGLRFKTVVGSTVSAEDATVTIRQDYNKYQNAIPLGLSVNERTGTEFAYSFYLFVQPATFTGEMKLKHVFHKGYQLPWPLMGPGVFILGNENKMRVVMNTYKNPYAHVDIQNIPVQKWFHVVLNAYKNALDVYINGVLANRVVFENSAPYQNYQDLILFSQIRNETLRSSQVAALPAPDETHTMDGIPLDGAFSGYLSNMKYARYALSIHEIKSLLNEGPSAKRQEVKQEIPPYFADTWWSNQS